MLKEYGNKSHTDENPKLKYYNISRTVDFSVVKYDNDVVLVKEHVKYKKDIVEINVSMG
jgi:hypothetical protein